jgi:hypothetical protein
MLCAKLEVSSRPEGRKGLQAMQPFLFSGFRLTPTIMAAQAACQRRG